MNNRDIEYLGALRDYYAKYRALPSFSAIAKLVGLKSTSAVSAMVDRMKLENYLDSSPDKRLIPGKLFFEREILDTVQAGSPRPANDSRGDAMSIDEYLIESPSRTIMLSVKGDSMTDAGILNGDTVIVKKGAPSQVGDIVVAIVDNEFTIKYLAHDKTGFYLQSGNIGYSNIRPKDHLEVFGLVVGMFRKY
jgi:repressor LexA